MKQKETVFKERVIRFLKSDLPGDWYMKTQEMSTKGIPDILMCMSGKFVAIELKVGKNKLTRLQDYTMRRIGLAGGERMVIRPDTWDDDKIRLKRMSDYAEKIKQKERQCQLQQSTR